MELDNGINLLELSGEQRDTFNGEPQQLPVSPYFTNKAIIDRCIALVLLTIGSLPLLLLVLVVRMTSRGPAFFYQARTGKDGKKFNVIKIRTMYQDAEKHTGPVWCSEKDPRITPVGRCYRFMHFDELPQLINVAKGEMCLVGPRPERPEIIERDRLKQEVPRYAERTNVLPGITGLAQINYPPDVTLDCVRRKVKLDLKYIEEASFWLDLRILLCTTLRMCGLRRGIPAKLLRVKYPYEEAQAPSSDGVPVQLPDTEFPVATGSPSRRLKAALLAVGKHADSLTEFDSAPAPDEEQLSSFENEPPRSKPELLVNKPR